VTELERSSSMSRAGDQDRRQAGRGRRLSDTLRALTVVADIGLLKAARALSEMAGTEIQAIPAQVRQVPLTSVPEMVGGSETVVAGVYLGITGDISGHIMLMLPLAEAHQLASMLLGEPLEAGEVLDEMAESALAEMGNVTGSFFLSALADSCSMTIMPTPPTVVVDMGGAILDAVLASLGEESSADIFAIDTMFKQSDEQVDAFFLVLPRQSDMQHLLERLPK
jgi:chemotaxis protein CheC